MGSAEGIRFRVDRRRTSEGNRDHGRGNTANGRARDYTAGVGSDWNGLIVIELR